jgi:pilus assembly protein CpaC
MRIPRNLRRAAALIVLCVPAFAQAPTATVPATPSSAASPHRNISLVEGRGELLEFQRDITKVVVSEPKIADAVVVSTREVMVNAKSPGNTTVLVWETGAEPAHYDITVLRDNSEFEAFCKQIQASASDSAISVTGSGETIVLSGKVKNAEESKRLASMAQTRAKTVINLLQVPPAPEPRQILLQVKIADINRSALSQIGFNLFSLNPKFMGATSTEQFASPRFSQLQTTGGQVSNPSVNFSDLLNLFAFRPDLNIGATIKALQERDLLQVLAEPNLICLEGKDASFLAGGQFPYPTVTTTPTGGAVAPVITVQFKPFGVKLDFTPTITPTGAIDLKVAPEYSSLDYTNSVTLEGFVLPALAQRRAETEVILQDGESFAIAGLINNQVIQTLDKVPGLGNIPVLGRLFQSRSTQKSDDELLVVITPHFVRPLTPQEKATLPDTPEAYLPSVAQEKAKSGKKTGTSQDPPAQPEFVGPRGPQIPKQ